MDRRKRRWRLALVCGLAVVVLWAAWRMGPGGDQRSGPDCVAGRQEIRDENGAVTRIMRTECRSD